MLDNVPEDNYRKLPPDQKEIYAELLSFLNSHDQNGRDIVAFILSDGSYCFSFTDSLDVLVNIAQESIFSDRLWVIVSVAYLEDKIRLLLENFLTDDEVSRDLLDPNKGPISSLIPMANMAFSLGLVQDIQAHRAVTEQVRPHSIRSKL
jgi:hypothetical protein